MTSWIGKLFGANVYTTVREEQDDFERVFEKRLAEMNKLTENAFKKSFPQQPDPAGSISDQIKQLQEESLAQQLEQLKSGGQYRDDYVTRMDDNLMYNHTHGGFRSVAPPEPTRPDAGVWHNVAAEEVQRTGWQRWKYEVSEGEYMWYATLQDGNCEATVAMPRELWENRDYDLWAHLLEAAEPQRQQHRLDEMRDDFRCPMPV